MRTAVFAICFLAAVVVAFALVEPALKDDIISHVNRQRGSWVAGRNSFFEKMNHEDAKRIMGTHLGGRKLPARRQVLATPPASFNSITAWPSCPTISTIYNQARCGSCWAFGCVETVQDRFCIHSNGSVNVALSFQDLVTCDGTNGGCEGGEPSTAFEYVESVGLVTNNCSPYTIPTCPPAQQPCLNFVPTPSCSKTCQSNYTTPWSQDLHQVQKPYSVNGVTNIMAEIATNGPVEAAFTVYEDFLSYKSGVYQHTTGKVLGGHAVKLIGYGTLNNTDYWLASNSWTTYWGDNGYFMILRGKDECGIESDIVAALPKL